MEENKEVVDVEVSEKNIDKGEELKFLDRLFAAIGYLFCGLLFFLPILVKPRSPFAKYHANQCLVLFIISIAFNTIIYLLEIIFVFASTASITFFLIINILESLAQIAFFILGIVHVCREETKPLPLIRKINLIDRN